MTEVSVRERETAPPARTTSLATTIGKVAERSAVPVFLVVLVVLFMTSPTIGPIFRSAGNLHNILANQSVTGLIALGMVLPLIAGYFDLSVPAVAGSTNVVTAALLATYQFPIPVGIGIGILVGLLLGAVNGLLVAVLRLNPFISTLGTYILLSGLLQLYAGGQVITNGMPPALGEWGAGRWLGIARPFWLLLVVAVLVWFLVTQTPFGRRIAAIGSNEQAARLAGVRVDRSIFLMFLLAGLLGGLAGVVLTMRNGGGDATSAIAYLFPAFAALFLGQTAIDPGKPNVWGTMFGVFLIAVAINGFILMGAQAWVTQVFNGAALILSVAIATLMARVRARWDRATQLEAMRS